jgi:hypothetical protein
VPTVRAGRRAGSKAVAPAVAAAAVTEQQNDDAAIYASLGIGAPTPTTTTTTTTTSSSSSASAAAAAPIQVGGARARRQIAARKPVFTASDMGLDDSYGGDASPSPKKRAPFGSAATAATAAPIAESAPVAAAMGLSTAAAAAGDNDNVSMWCMWLGLDASAAADAPLVRYARQVCSITLVSINHYLHLPFLC